MPQSLGPPSQALMNLISTTSNFVFPSACAACGADLFPGALPLCGRCSKGLSYLRRDGVSTELSIDRLFALGEFEGPLRALIHAFKYRGRDYLATTLMDWWAAHCTVQPTTIDA